MTKAKNVTQAAELRAGETDDRKDWKRFKRDSKHERRVLAKLLDARAAHPDGSRPAQVYDHLIVQTMALYVSPAALERYLRGFSADELGALQERGPAAWGVVDAESNMLDGLQRMGAAHPLKRQHLLDEFIYHLYIRWQYIDMSDGAGIEALSAAGVNVAKV